MASSAACYFPIEILCPQSLNEFFLCHIKVYLAGFRMRNIVQPTPTERFFPCFPIDSPAHGIVSLKQFDNRQINGGRGQCFGLQRRPELVTETVPALTPNA